MVSAFSAASGVMFASIGLVALAVVLLARAYSPGALATGIIGLLALTTASTWIARAGVEMDADLTAARLRAVVEPAVPAVDDPNLRALTAAAEERRLALERLTAEKGQADVRLELASRAAEQQAVDAERLAVELRIAKNDLRAAQKTNAELTGRLAAIKPTPTIIDVMPEPTPEVKATVATEPRVVVVEPHVTVAPHEAPSPDPGNAVVATTEPQARLDPAVVRQRLGNTPGTKGYTTEALTRREVVTGLQGSWYMLHLKRGNAGLVFDDRAFQMPQASEAVADSMRQLQADILGPAAQVAKRVRLFVRGGADSRRVSGSTDSPDARTVAVIPRLANGKYGTVAKTVRLAGRVQNEDLPNLRADWVRRQIQPLAGATDIAILDNPPSPGRERTVDLLLFVEW